MNVLITGTTGFLGSLLTKKALNNGYNVFGTSMHCRTYRIKNIAENENFQLIKIDLSKKSEIQKLPENIDYVFHTASQQPSRPNLSFIDYLNANVKITRNILDYYHDKRLKAFVLSSTATILGNHTKEVNTESEVIFPLHDYTLTKLWAENLLKNFSVTSECKCVTLRYPSIFGKNQYGGIAYYFYHQALNNEDIKVFSQGTILRNIVHVSDVVKANLSVIDNLKYLEDYELFLIGSSNSAKMLDIAKKVRNLMKSKSKILTVKDETFNNNNVVLDISKAKTLLNYNPLSVEEGLKKYILEMKGLK